MRGPESLLAGVQQGIGDAQRFLRMSLACEQCGERFASMVGGDGHVGARQCNRAAQVALGVSHIQQLDVPLTAQCQQVDSRRSSERHG